MASQRQQQTNEAQYRRSPPLYDRQYIERSYCCKGKIENSDVNVAIGSLIKLVPERFKKHLDENTDPKVTSLFHKDLRPNEKLFQQ